MGKRNHIQLGQNISFRCNLNIVITKREGGGASVMFQHCRENVISLEQPTIHHLNL